MPEWDELFKEEEFRLKEPNQSVVELVKIFKSRNFKKVFDLGCGTGRHLIYLAKQGFEVYGSDVSERGLSYAKRWLEKEGLDAIILKSDMTAIPQPDAFFDSVISIYVIYHNTLDNIKKAISEIHRVLRAGGLTLLIFMSKKHYRYGKGEMIEKGTFISSLGIDTGIPHHFSDRDEVETLMKSFKIIKINLKKYVDENQNLHAHWQVLAEKT
jgi:ubiquinone/menaquinone biosynthesis C-methylase UbiE